MKLSFGKKKEKGRAGGAARSISAGITETEEKEGGRKEMRDTFATRLKEKRRQRGMSQEQLASVCGVSVQAVSKWECSQSYPDIELLEIIADTFGTTIDALLREDAPAVEPVVAEPAEPAKPAECAEAPTESTESKEEDADERLLSAVAEKFGVPRESIGSVDIHMSTGDSASVMAEQIGDVPGLLDDGVLRVVQFLGKRPLGKYDIYEDGEKIPLMLSGYSGDGQINVEIWGDAELSIGDNQGVSVPVSAGGDMTVEGESINGSVSAGGDLTVNGAAINGPVSAGGDVSLNGGNGCINGPANAGGDINCGSVGGGVNAGGDVDCGTVGSGVSAGGDVDCGYVGGSVSANGDVDCSTVGGKVEAGGDVSSGDVGSYVNAGGDVSCESVGGDVKAGGDVSCDSVEGNVNAGGDVECGDIGGSVYSDGEIECGSVHISAHNKKCNKGAEMPKGMDFSGLGEYISGVVGEYISNRVNGDAGRKNSAEDNDGEKEIADDSVFARALGLAVDEGKISTPILMRRLGVKFREAEGIISRMEAFGYIKRDQNSRALGQYLTVITRQELDEITARSETNQEE